MGTNIRVEFGGIRKKNEGKRGSKQEREKESDREREREIEREREREIEKGIFSVFRRSNPDGLRVKVDPRIVGYAWVPISWSFVKLHEVGNFPTLTIFSLKAM